MTARILFVDDEPNVLAGFERLFRKDFQLDTAPGGTEGLARIAESGPYSIVLSDMRMPRMSGAEFLAAVRDVSPESIRMVLTGETDIASAMRAVNEGAIFRFLLKPCAEPTLRSALEAAQRQYELQHAERDLLQQTLRGSVKVLSEVLSLVNPAAFGRAVRIQRYVRHMTAKLELGDDAWQFEVAAMLSQIGCVTLPPGILEAVSAGEQLSDAEHARYAMHTSVAHDLLVQIPRLENVAMMICRQTESVPAAPKDDLIALGAQILKICLAFDQTISRGLGAEAALRALRTKPNEYSSRLVATLSDLEFSSMSYQRLTIPVSRLETGMIIDQEVRTTTGLLLVGRGQETTLPMVVRLQNFHQNGAIGETVVVLVLRPGTEAPAA
jgi:response regulator RpfG family c-di-GMP phosphodiesterase